MKHEDYWEMLSLGAGGGLDAEDERLLRAHVSVCSRCEAELGALQEVAEQLAKLPTPTPSAGVVERVRRRAHVELAGRADERLSDMLLAFVLVFSWTVTSLSYMAVRFFSGAPLAFWSSLSTTGLRWSAIYFGVAWVGGAAAVVLLGLNYRRTRRTA